MKKLILFSMAVSLLSACGESDWMGDGNVFYEPTELVLSKSSLEELIVGESCRLYAAFDPAETTDSEMLWSSNDESVVTVDQTGTVKAVGLGETTVTVQSAAYPELQATCAVSVTSESGIRVYDLLLDEPIGDLVTFVRNATGSRDYYYEIFVHDTFDKSVTFDSSNEGVVTVEEKEFDGRPGFTLIPGEELGEATISIQSTRNEDVHTSFAVNLKTVKVTGVSLSLNADGSEASDALTASLTVSHTKAIRVVFATDDDETDIPENSVVHVESSNPDVATVDAEGTQDPATQTVSFNVYMVDNPGNAPEGTTTIKVVTDDGGYEASLTVTAQCPGVQGIVLDQELSEPIHAGETLQLAFKTVPEDAYVQTVTWTSADETVATVDENGLVTVKPDFVFDPANCTATEILITATTTDVSGVSASCKLRPYQYVPAEGVMVTDQWGNRMRGTSSTASKITSPDNCYACIQYCSGGGKNKTALFNDPQTWAVASPAVEGVDKVGSMPVYLTATPYPYTYPTIADPDQPFYWACYSNSRFSIAGAGYEDGSQATGWSGYSKDDGKAKLFLGHTCKFWTGHSSSGADATFVRVWRYVEGEANSSEQSKSSNLLFRFTVHTTDSKANVNYGNPSLKNDDGTAKVFNFLNVAGIALPFDDPCPTPWTGPMPRPVGYYTLDDNGAPDQFTTWGDIPVPTTLTEIY
ncbi:MAG TPA: Ig-like domain-containing protein [Candidatus Alistipes intestinigallinarum]|uniref:Ig-like domain-containing protein n=1 Tax=Candidatus Alistipes intestinigallinarum TaxID=2838440 RepID=A0A9D1Z2L3_9BACT|nr:Ig-like domain-containing protein [Candidatus Alistipes intestinigallinarum]